MYGRSFGEEEEVERVNDVKSEVENEKKSLAHFWNYVARHKGGKARPIQLARVHIIAREHLCGFFLNV